MGIMWSCRKALLLSVILLIWVNVIWAAPSGTCNPLDEETHCYDTIAERDAPHDIVDGVVVWTLKWQTGATSEGGMLKRLFLLFWLDPSVDNTLTYIVTIVNYALWLGASIAIVFIIYWFARIIFSDNHDEAFGNARKIVRGASIALAVMILAMVLARFMLQFYNATTYG